MNNWKKVNIEGIAKIEKCVAEFNIWELNISPYAKFKIKVFEDNKNNFTGYSNIQVIDEVGGYNGAVGYGNTVEEALEDTIKYFFELLSIKEDWQENDFAWSDPLDF